MAVIAGKSRNAAGGPVWRPLSRAVGKLQVAAILGGALFRYAQSRPMGELQGSRYHRHYRAGYLGLLGELRETLPPGSVNALRGG